MEGGLLLLPQGLFRVDRRAWGPGISLGCSHLSPATKEAIGEEEGGRLGFGQAAFAVFNKGIERTGNLICERKFQDIEKGPVSEGSKGLQASSHISPRRPGKWGWVPRAALALQSQSCVRSSFQSRSSKNCPLLSRTCLA